MDHTEINSLRIHKSLQVVHNSLMEYHHAEKEIMENLKAAIRWNSCALVDVGMVSRNSRTMERCLEAVTAELETLNAELEGASDPVLPAPADLRQENHNRCFFGKER